SRTSRRALGGREVRTDRQPRRSLRGLSARWRCHHRSGCRAVVGSIGRAAMAGRYFDDWKVGDRVSHTITRTVTETDNVLISALTHNPQPMHLDKEVAAKSEFKQPIVNSIFTFGLM